MIYRIPLILLLLSASPLLANDDKLYTQTTSTFIWQLEPQQVLDINKMHSWVLTLLTRDGNTVEQAQFSVRGGMPEHDHGLPTAPQFTRHLDGGRYLLQGVRFHMPGQWELIITAKVNNTEESARFIIDL